MLHEHNYSPGYKNWEMLGLAVLICSDVDLEDLHSCRRLQVEEKDREWEKKGRQARQQALLDLDDAVRKERVAGQGRIQEVIERQVLQQRSLACDSILCSLFLLQHRFWPVTAGLSSSEIVSHCAC